MEERWGEVKEKQQVFCIPEYKPTLKVFIGNYIFSFNLECFNLKISLYIVSLIILTKMSKPFSWTNLPNTPKLCFPCKKK